VDGRKETDKTVIANGFGKYFSNIGRQFAEVIPPSRHPPEYYIHFPPNKHTMFLSPTDPEEIVTILKSCKNKMTTGDDGISLTLLKQLSKVIIVCQLLIL